MSVSSYALRLLQCADTTQVFMALTTHGLDTHINELTSCLSASYVWFMHVHCTRSHTGQRRTGSVHLADQRIRGFLNDMRYINPRFTYLLTYLDQAQRDCGQSKQTSSLQISVSSLPAGELKTAVRWRQFVKTATLPAGARAW